MAAMPKPLSPSTEDPQDHRQMIALATLNLTPLVHVSTQQTMSPTPASTESLIGHTMEEYVFSPMGPNTTSHADSLPTDY